MRRREPPRRLVVALLIGIVALAAGLRAPEAMNPRVGDESTDERFYAVLARGLADDLRYGGSPDGPLRPFHAAPGAPAAFALAYRITPAPRSAPTAIPAAYWLLLLVGVLLVPASFALGRALAGDAAGVIAATVVATYPPLVRTTGELLSEPLGALLLTMAVTLLVLGGRRGRRGALALAGILLGATALVRPDLLVAVFAGPLALAFLALCGRSVRVAAAQAAVVLGAALLTLAPWVAYASSRTGELVPVVESGGPTLLIGTFLPGDGTNQGFKRAHAAETRKRLPRLRALDDTELPGLAVINTVRLRRPDLGYQAAVRAQARENLRRYALGRPGAFAGMMARKVGRMWSRPSQVSGPVHRALHASLVVLAFVGLAVGAFTRPGHGLLLIFAVLAASSLLHAVLVAHARYALPLMPLLTAGGVAGCALIASALLNRNAVARPRRSAP